MRVRVIGFLGAAVWLSGGAAMATNTAKPRVNPSFLGASCMATIERGTPLRFDLGIPYEDADVSMDEPTDSRTFQFFALCRDPGPLEDLPRWIDGDDVMRAQAVNETIEEPPATDVMATAAAWDVPGHGGGPCVVAMTSAEQRMPITCEATADGFTWDGGDAPAGSYMVYGYTFEPADNVWTARGGVVRVIEPGDAEAAGPAVAFSFPLSSVDASFEGGVIVTGCVDGAEGTTLAIDWATAPDLDDRGDAAWAELPDVAVEAGAFEVAFVPPAEAEYKAIFFRARVTDPSGAEFVAYTHVPAVIVPGCADPHGGHYPTIDSCGVGTAGDWSTPPQNAVDCAGGGTTGTGTDTDADSEADADADTDADTDTEADADADTDADPDGCGCRTAGGEAPWLVAFWLAAALRRRRTAR